MIYVCKIEYLLYICIEITIFWDMTQMGDTIKERRKMLKINQRTLAELSGVGINTLTKIERNEANPTIEVLNKILDTLGLEIQIVIKNSNRL